MVVWYLRFSTSPTKFSPISCPGKGGGIQPVSYLAGLSWVGLVWLDIPSALMECPSNYWYCSACIWNGINIISTLGVNRGRFGCDPKPGFSLFYFCHRAYTPVAIAAYCSAYSVHKESQRTNGQNATTNPQDLKSGKLCDRSN